MRIGVLAIQGSVEEHVAALERCGADVREIRRVKELEGIDGLVMPGGESTTIGKLMKIEGLDKAIKKLTVPIWGTCAGTILLSQLGLMDIEVERNAYGRQLESFEADAEILDWKPFHAIFIRAPKISHLGKNVETLAKYEGEVIMCRQDNILITTFHPELTEDMRVHEYFLKMCDE